MRTNYGFHPQCDREQPYLFVDACMQAWPDAEYDIAHRHGVTAYAVTAWRPHATLDEALEDLMFWHLIARKHPNLGVAMTADDIRKAKNDGKAVFIIAAQGGNFIGNKLHRIEAFYRLGLRIFLPAYNASNLICDGCLDRTDSGLTRFGQIVVDECNRVGMLLDCTHIGKRASLDIIERSSEPVVFTHSNVKPIVDSRRNIDDEQILACVARGGVIGLAPFGPFLLKRGKGDWPCIDDLIEHVDYVANLTGSTNHIGIGTDMSLGTYPDHDHDPWGEPAYPSPGGDYDRLVCADVRSPMRALKDWNAYPEVLNFIDKLGQKGYTHEDVAKILGGNFMRIFDKVWK